MRTASDRRVKAAVERLVCRVRSATDPRHVKPAAAARYAKVLGTSVPSRRPSNGRYRAAFAHMERTARTYTGLRKLVKSFAIQPRGEP